MSKSETSSLSRENVPLPGEVVGEVFILEKMIAKKSTNLVFLAYHRHLNLKVVLRFFLVGATVEALTLDRFERIASLLTKTKHANLATIYAHGNDPRWGPYLVEEYLEGENLAHFISRSGPLPMGLFVPLASQILKGMGGVHSRGIFHGSLRPPRVILTQKTRVTAKVRSVGLLQILKEFAMDLDIQGDFVAPEQIIHGQADVRTDVYALGGLFYWMLSAQSPFHHNVSENVKQYIHESAIPLEKVLPPGSAIPQELIDLIHDCLKRNANERITDANEIVERLIDVAPASMFRMPKSLLLESVNIRRLTEGMEDESQVPQTPLPTPIVEPISFQSDDSLLAVQKLQKNRIFQTSVLVFATLIIAGGGYLYFNQQQYLSEKESPVREIPSVAAPIPEQKQKILEHEQKTSEPSQPPLSTVLTDKKEIELPEKTPEQNTTGHGEQELVLDSKVENSVNEQEIVDKEEKKAEQAVIRAIKVTFKANQAGSKLVLDGQERGILPQTVEVSEGKHEVQIIKAGYQTETQTLEIKNVKTFNFELKKLKKTKKPSRRRFDSENVDIDPNEGVVTPINF